MYNFSSWVQPASSLHEQRQQNMRIFVCPAVLQDKAIIHVPDSALKLAERDARLHQSLDRSVSAV